MPLFSVEWSNTLDLRFFQTKWTGTALNNTNVRMQCKWNEITFLKETKDNRTIVFLTLTICTMYLHHLKEQENFLFLVHTHTMIGCCAHITSVITPHNHIKKWRNYHNQPSLPMELSISIFCVSFLTAARISMPTTFLPTDPHCCTYIHATSEPHHPMHHLFQSQHLPW